MLIANTMLGISIVLCMILCVFIATEGTNASTTHPVDNRPERSRSHAKSRHGRGSGPISDVRTKRSSHPVKRLPRRYNLTVNH